MTPQLMLQNRTSFVSKVGRCFCAEVKKTKLLEYKHKKIPQDNEVINHEDGTFVFISRNQNKNMAYDNKNKKRERHPDEYATKINKKRRKSN